MKCTLSLSLATVCNDFFFFFHVHIESFYTRVSSSLHLGYTIKWMERVRTAAGGDEQLLRPRCCVAESAMERKRLRQADGGVHPQHSHKSPCVGAAACSVAASWHAHQQCCRLTLSTVTAGVTRGADWSAAALLVQSVVLCALIQLLVNGCQHDCAERWLYINQSGSYFGTDNVP